MSNLQTLNNLISSVKDDPEFVRIGEEIDIALKIKQKRLELGWTQAELALKMGVTQNVISRIESLDGGISSGTIAKFCKATGLELSFDMPSEKLSIFDMANYILQYGETKLEKNFDISNLKINKLLFFVEKAIVEMMGGRIFDWPVQAWQHGPVYPQLYHRYSSFGRDTIKEPNNNVVLAPAIAKIVNKTLDKYIEYSAKKLEDMSHKESEWSSVYVEGVRNIELKFKVS
jgi:uncharacterized phage-associated protein/DNA-binding XRE family transcriptional regulator